MSLTAVDEFARLHDRGDLEPAVTTYRSLLPASPPAPGEQYAFAVDLDACSGCKACVVACHSLNGLDDDESWRSVGLLQGRGQVAFQQTVTTACHHCVEPACLAGCPVDAYDKDPVTGIVSHLDDQCIGCSYCTLTCPYEVPRFNKTRGIVRKCDMCRGRLAEGEAPACAQACPNGAISITLVRKADVLADSAAPGAALVPGAPPSSLTAPTTSYRTTRRVPPDARAADHHALRPGHAHPPLAVMLVLTQMAVGALVAEMIAGGHGRVGSVVSAATGLLALAASTLHLGRPRYAFRAVLGIGHSWLSREIVAFGAFAAAAPAYAVTQSPVAAACALAAGVGGVACSVMLYAVTGRRWWRPRRSVLTFALSAASTGSAVSATWLAASGAVDAAARAAVVAATAVAVKLAWEATWLRRRGAADDHLGRAALLLRGDLWNRVQLRFAVGLAGGIVVPAVVAAAVTPAASAEAGAALCAATLAILAGELIERDHFFRVAVAPRMPGELR